MYPCEFRVIVDVHIDVTSDMFYETALRSILVFFFIVSLEWLLFFFLFYILRTLFQRSVDEGITELQTVDNIVDDLQTVDLM